VHALATQMPLNGPVKSAVALSPAAALLTACAAWQPPQMSPAELEFTEADILAVEREQLEAAHASGARLDMVSIDAVDGLICTRLRRTLATPDCRYRLHYTKRNGERRSRSRNHMTFSRDEMGRWEIGLIVSG
jgi:hypothetical protein